MYKQKSANILSMADEIKKDVANDNAACKDIDAFNSYLIQNMRKLTKENFEIINGMLTKIENDLKKNNLDVNSESYKYFQTLKGDMNGYERDLSDKKFFINIDRCNNLKKCCDAILDSEDKYKGKYRNLSKEDLSKKVNSINSLSMAEVLFDEIKSKRSNSQEYQTLQAQLTDLKDVIENMQGTRANIEDVRNKISDVTYAARAYLDIAQGHRVIFGNNDTRLKKVEATQKLITYLEKISNNLNSYKYDSVAERAYVNMHNELAKEFRSLDVVKMEYETSGVNEKTERGMCIGLLDRCIQNWTKQGKENVLVRLMVEGNVEDAINIFKNLDVCKDIFSKKFRVGREGAKADIDKALAVITDGEMIEKFDAGVEAEIDEKYAQVENAKKSEINLDKSENKVMEMDDPKKIIIDKSSDELLLK